MRVRALLIALLVAASLSACSSPVSTQPVAETKSPEQVLEEHKALIRSLYYDESKAFERSFDSWVDFVVANNYPGSYDAAESRKCSKKWKGLTEYSALPDLSTVYPDPNWVGPEGSEKWVDWIFAGKKPEGRTYSVTLATTLNDQSRSSSVHVTVLDGKAYFYSGFCV